MHDGPQGEGGHHEGDKEHKKRVGEGDTSTIFLALHI